MGARGGQYGNEYGINVGNINNAISQNQQNEAKKQERLDKTNVKQAKRNNTRNRLRSKVKLDRLEDFVFDPEAYETEQEDALKIRRTEAHKGAITRAMPNLTDTEVENMAGLKTTNVFKFIDQYRKQDEEGREQSEQALNTQAQKMMMITQSPNPKRAWNSYRDEAIKANPQMTDTLPADYDPDYIGNMMAESADVFKTIQTVKLEKLKHSNKTDLEGTKVKGRLTTDNNKASQTRTTQQQKSKNSLLLEDKKSKNKIGADNNATKNKRTLEKEKSNNKLKQIGKKNKSRETIENDRAKYRRDRANKTTTSKVRTTSIGDKDITASKDKDISKRKDRTTEFNDMTKRIKDRTASKSKDTTEFDEMMKRIKELD